MSAANAPGKTSSDSGQHPGLDRWSQRRLQRLNTEQGFREQRQGGGQPGSGPPPLNDAGNYAAAQYTPSDTQSTANPAFSPLPLHQPPYSSTRSNSTNPPPTGLAIQPQSLTGSSRSPSNPSQDASNPYAPSYHQYSPRDTTSHQESLRPNPPGASRSYSYQSTGPDESPPAPNPASLAASKTVRTTHPNRQSIHNGIARENSSMSQSGASGYNYAAAAPAPAPQKGEVGRGTPQPGIQIGGEDMTDEDVMQLIKDHRELREKYTKVKKYYFEKEDQVKQLQNSLAHQRLSQSRTSLDDSEYTTRFNRLDGLIAQLAFSIRKSWRSVPSWLSHSVNKDAMVTGKQEMTAVGRAFISAWLVEEVFDKCFHPDLEPSLSSQLKVIQKNIRRYAPLAHTAEEDEVLTSKVVNWRLATLEGLQDSLRSAQCATYRQQLTDLLKDHLIASLATHLQDPPPSDLDGGVHMIIELVVSIAIHLPLESRDLQIDYYLPGHGIVHDQMKLESGIPSLSVSVADEAAERGSTKSGNSDGADPAEPTMGNTTTIMAAEQPGKKRGMLSALTGGAAAKSRPSAQSRPSNAGASTSSLPRPESAHGAREDAAPRVRMAAGIGVQVRGRGVLVKAPIFST